MRIYVWGNGNLSRTEGNGHQESRKFRIDEVDKKMLVSTSNKLQDAVRRLSASEQGEGEQLESFIGIWKIQFRCRLQRIPVPFGAVIPFLRALGR